MEVSKKKPVVSRYTSKMWKAFAQYQNIADHMGHGKSWAVMCTAKSMKASQDALDDVVGKNNCMSVNDALCDAIDVIYAIDNKTNDGSVSYFSDSATFKMEEALDAEYYITL
jgi:hypothetical protein